MNNKILIGYSIRSLLEDKSWTQKRRKLFLINPDIKLPKSVSNVGWDMIDEFIDLDNDDNLFSLTFGFQNQDELLNISHYQIQQTDRVVVRSCIHYLHFVPTFVWALNMQSYQDDDGFYFLGYDVADSGMTSGLSNCGYTENDLKYCQVQYLPFLNQHGLFDDFDVAVDFLDYTNRRVVEHTPFYVYSLYTNRKI